MISDRDVLDQKIYWVHMFVKYFNMSMIFVHSYIGIKLIYITGFNYGIGDIIGITLRVIAIILHTIFFMYARKAILGLVARKV